MTPDKPCRWTSERLHGDQRKLGYDTATASSWVGGFPQALEINVEVMGRTHGPSRWSYSRLRARAFSAIGAMPDIVTAFIAEVQCSGVSSRLTQACQGLVLGAWLD
jgi:hypothetical protein